jgi:protoporphyrinogen/coproporphyrinogen III oxidase
VRAFVGGARDRAQGTRGATDEALIRTSLRELQRFMGGLGPPSFARVYRYERGTPQPEVGHAQWVERVRALQSDLQNLALVGPGYDGVGIPDCVRRARRLAESITQRA